MKNINSLIVLFLLLIANTVSTQAQVSTKYSENLVDYREVILDVNQLKTTLHDAPMNSSVVQNRNSNTIIELPIPKGGVQRFRVVEAPILSPELSESRPQVKSYIAKGIDDPTSIARFNITSSGFYAVLKSVIGISIIEKIDQTNNNNSYITYYDHDIIDNEGNLGCRSEDEIDSTVNTTNAVLANSCFQIGNNLRRYDMVVTCSGEFYALNGGTNALVESALLNRITQINTVYEAEVATSFSIVEFLLNNNASTDPYMNPTDTSQSLMDTENYINANVTVSSWDIGHGFHEITCGTGCGWAGRAGLGVVGTSGKAKGYTYLPNDIPSSITVLLHEFGHQFGNRHTNYGCNSNNACSRFEPGQGSTIMSTGAGCDGGDYFANRTDYFNVASLQTMVNFMNTGNFVGGSNCGTVSSGTWSDGSTLIPTGNNMPSADANVNGINGLVIPHSTPFILAGSGSDADGLNSLTYNWEQYDTDFSGSDAPDDTSASTTAPLFRSYPPSTSNVRTVPMLSSVLAGNVTTGIGEILPSVARNLTWRLTVRDNEFGGGGIACDQISLTVGSDGPFKISSQNTSTAWMSGDTETVTWDVANTDTPVYSCANIDILYSSDGGSTFSTTLATGVPNNGSYNIIVPGLSTSTGRIKIVCSGGTNVFFDINDVDILVTSSCNAVGGTIANDNTVTAIAGDVSLNLDVMAGLPVNSVSGILDTNDSNTNLTVENNGGGNCISFGNNPKYETIELATSTNSNVTFTRTNQPDYTSMIGLFNESYNPSNVCDNWLNSNGNFTGSFINISSSFTEPLTTGTKYVLLASGFNSSIPVTGNYNVSFSQTLYNVGAINATGYQYTYVIVNNTSGNIVAFDANSDLSNQSNFPSGNYSVYGLSYLSGEPIGTYVGNAFSTLQTDLASSIICGDLSSNSKNVNILPGAQTTYIYSNGWSPSNPIGVSSSSDIIIVSAGTANISANTSCSTLTVNAGAALTIDSGVTLTATTVDLNSTSTQFSSLISNGNIIGSVNYNRHVALIGSAPTGTNDLVSAPVVGQTFNTFHLANANLPAQGTLRAFARYNTSAAAFQNYDTTVNSATTIDAGIGYRTATTDGNTLNFSGTVRTNDVLNVPISDAVAGGAWNLIGNPYPSYIDFAAFFNANFGEFASGSAYQAIYGYDGDTSNGWTVWNMATIANTAVTELIAPGQAFFVKAKNGGGLVDYTTAMRVIGSSDDFILGRSTNTDVPFSQLNLSSTTKNAFTQIYFINGTTKGLDVGYDAGSYAGNASEFSIFSNLVEDNTGLDMAIQSLPFEELNGVIVPLGINAQANETLTISIDDRSDLPTEFYIYLEDTFENTLTLLNSSNYTFTSASELAGTGRFYLRYSTESLSIKDNDFNNLHIYATATPKEVVINGLLTDDTEATVYDIQGRVVIKTNLNINNTSNIIDVSALTTGIYIVKVSNNNKVKTQKVVVR